MPLTDKGAAVVDAAGAAPLTGPLVVLLGTALICVPLAVLLWLLVPALGRFGLFNVFVHAESIGLSVCALTVLTRHACSRVGPRWRWLLLPLLIGASFVGFVAGTMLARWLTGAPVLPLGFFDGGYVGVSLLITGIITATLTWFFIAREQLAALRIAAAREGEKAEAAKLAMLRAQVEPHMLFNTLANLRALIATDPERAICMLDRLNDFLRKTLDGSRQAWSTLDEEFKVLENYLELMKIRMGERLTFELHLPAELRAVSVPSLLLQPVVENAIRHGVEPAMDGGHITVRAEQRGAALIFKITDTGVGFAAGETPKPQSGFGLLSLRERLAGLEGAADALHIDSPPPGQTHGTRVTIRIPA